MHGSLSIIPSQLQIAPPYKAEPEAVFGVAFLERDHEVRRGVVAYGH